MFTYNLSCHTRYKIRQPFQSCLTYQWLFWLLVFDTAVLNLMAWRHCSLSYRRNLFDAAHCICFAHQHKQATLNMIAVCLLLHFLPIRVRYGAWAETHLHKSQIGAASRADVGQAWRGSRVIWDGVGATTQPLGCLQLLSCLQQKGVMEVLTVTVTEIAVCCQQFCNYQIMHRHPLVWSVICI